MSRIPGLECSLHEAALRLERSDPVMRRGGLRRTGLGRKLSLRSIAIAVLLLVVICGTAAAGTLLVLRGSVIPAPAPRDVPLEQTPVPDSARVAPERGRDPDAGPDWAVRVARSRTGLICSTVGQVDGGEFGLVGVDRRFRRLAVGIVDGCGLERENAASLIGARVFDAPEPAHVRTVLNGVGGPDLRRVRVTAAGRTRPVAVGEGGVFLAAFRGYPEDLAIDVDLRFADGHVERHPFGASPDVLLDPAGGQAWRASNVILSRQPPAGCRGVNIRRSRCAKARFAPQQTCTVVRSARESADRASSTGACGLLKPTPTGRLRRTGYFFAIRRESRAVRRRVRLPLGGGPWRASPRTLVLGAAGDDVRRVDVLGPRGTVRAKKRSGGSFAVIFGPETVPHQLRVRVTTVDGLVRTFRGDTNLIKPRVR